MFLFPWLDWGIDISDFEKIDFLGHGRFLAFSAPCKSDFLTWGIILRAQLKVPRVKILKIFFSEFFKKFLKFPKRTSYDHDVVVSQKSIFLEKTNLRTSTWQRHCPSPISYWRDMFIHYAKIVTNCHWYVCHFELICSNILFDAKEQVTKMLLDFSCLLLLSKIFI